MKPILETLRALAALCALALLALGLSGCSSDKAGMASPELPARHWLDEAPGIPIENKEQYDAAVPNLYVPGKKFTFEDCVYLTVQQSPSLVNSAVDIEIKTLDLTTAAWKYLPEPRMTIMISQNLTNYNVGHKDVSGDYGRPQFEIGFYAPFPNPAATYFEEKVRFMLAGIAISTHRKAVGEAIYKIAKAYLTLQAKQYSIAAQKEMVPIARETTEYWRKVEAVEGNQGSKVSYSMQHEREAVLDLERAEMEEAMQRTNLKILAGIDPHQTFDIDATHADEMLKGFNGKKLRWDSRWTAMEDNLLLRAQVKLADYNIMLAWAQYVPDMRFAVNMNAPRGQSQPNSGPADEFFHFTFDIPLLDWGRRYRGVQSARMVKAQAFHMLSGKRFEYQNRWLQAEQQVALALTNLKLAENRYQTAQMQYDETRISFENGLESLPLVAEKQENMLKEQLKYIDKVLDYRLAQLDWMMVSGTIQERFLGLPDSTLGALAGNATGAAPAEDLPEDPLFSGKDGFAVPPAEAGGDERPIGHAVPMILQPLPGDARAPEAGLDLKTEPTLDPAASQAPDAAQPEAASAPPAEARAAEAVPAEAKAAEDKPAAAKAKSRGKSKSKAKSKS